MATAREHSVHTGTVVEVGAAASGNERKCGVVTDAWWCSSQLFGRLPVPSSCSDLGGTTRCLSCKRRSCERRRADHETRAADAIWKVAACIETREPWSLPCANERSWGAACLHMVLMLKAECRLCRFALFD